MQLVIITCSKSKNDFLKTGENEFLQRISQYARIQLIEVPIPDSILKLPPEQRVLKEGLELLKRIKAGSVLVALDETGKTFSSKKFSELIDKEFTLGCKLITFIIGGPYGLSSEILKAARYKVSLSEFTFTSQLARLILTEQLYRAISILKGLPYHKE